MKKTFKKKLRCVVEVEFVYEVVDAEFTDNENNLLELSNAQTAELVEADNSKTQSYGLINVRVSPVEVESIGKPTTPLEISCLAASSFGLEVPYLKRNLETTLKNTVESLLNEVPRRFDDYRESEGGDVVPKPERIRKLSYDGEKQMRRRFNPLGERRPAKNDEQIETARADATKRLQSVLRKLLNDNERITKAAAARQLRLGSETNRSASMNGWLDANKLHWETEVQTAQKNFPRKVRKI